MKTLPLCLALVLFCLSLRAAAASTKVFFVGGYRASPAQMRCWEEGARKNSPGEYEFVGIPYPSGVGASFEEAVAGASTTIQKIVAEINANPNQSYLIAGHSSGAAISNTIAARATNPARIRLVDLDGFVPPASLRARVPTTCWAARNGKLLSRNYDAMGICGPGTRVYGDRHCNTAWCLHFSLVIRSTPADLGTDFVSRGYLGCNTNLDWLR